MTDGPVSVQAGESAPPDDLLAEIETLAEDLARQSGQLAWQSLERALEITYKTEARGNRPPSDPVSEVDHAVEELLRRSVRERFPDHDLLGEEVDEHPDPDHRWLWVIDPVDGTANFINGFPLFAVSIGVLHRGLPVAGAIWCSTTHALRPGVYHARRGAGLRFDGAPLDPGEGSPGTRRRLSAAPGGSPGGTREWDHRVTGSAAVELAYVAAGIFTSARFFGLRIWDVAAGSLLCREAGREVWIREGREWRPLERFRPPDRLPRGTKEQREPSLRDWRQPLLAGTPQAVALLRERLRPPPAWRRALRRLRRLSAAGRGR